MEYSTEIFDLVNNPEYNFYKLSIDGKCPIEEFIAEVEKVSKDTKNFQRIIALMDNFSSHILLPKEKFRQIVAQKGGRADLYEFKKDDLRIYVILQKPEIYVVRGGWKSTQDKDIAKLKKETQEFPQQ